MSGFQLEYFLVSFLSRTPVTFFFVNNRKIKKGRRVSFLIDCNLEKVDRLVEILSELVQEHADVEISFKIFRVNSKGSLIEAVTFFERFICRWSL